MAKIDPPTRAPRGSKPVMQAFFAALDAVPAERQSEVARAAQAMIRDMLKDRRDAARSAAATAKARTAARPGRPITAAKTAGVAKRGRGRPRKVQPQPEEPESEPTV